MQNQRKQPFIKIKYKARTETKSLGPQIKRIEKGQQMLQLNKQNQKCENLPHEISFDEIQRFQFLIIIMKVIGFLILVVLPLFCNGSQYAPLLGDLPGFTKGQPLAKLQIQIVYDPVCDDSSAFDRTTWKSTEQYILTSQTLKNAVKFRYIPFALPYHIASQKIIQALIYVKQQSSSQALQLMRYFLENIQQFSDQGCKLFSSDQIIDKIATAISNQKGFSKTQLVKAMQHGSEFDGKARKWAKFALGPMSIAGTPSLYINWVQVDNGSSMTSSQWVNLLQSLVNKQRTLQIQQQTM